MDIFLVRHGEAQANWGESADPGLSDLGRRQACETARLLLKDTGGQCQILSSPLRRARQTAEPLAMQLQQLVRVEEAFREIPAPVPLAQRQAWLRQFMLQKWQGQGEDLMAWRNAALQCLLELQQPTVVYTHFLVINAVVGEALCRPETLCFWPANGSVTRLRNTGPGLELLTLGLEIETRVN